MRLIKGELPQEIVKGHHDNKACDNAEGGQSGPALGMGFRNHSEPLIDSSNRNSLMPCI